MKMNWPQFLVKMSGVSTLPRITLIVLIISVCCNFVVSCTGGEDITAVHKPPEIIKRGTVDVDMVETTPVVFQGKLYRFEYVRGFYYEKNTTGDSYFRFIDVEKGEPTESFAAGYDLGSAYCENGSEMHVFAVNEWGGNEIHHFVSTDLKEWNRELIFSAPEGWTMYNTAVCKNGEGNYILAVELGAPPELVGRRFTMRFLQSKDDMETWSHMEEEYYVYTKDRYSACPSLHWLDSTGYYYMTYLEARPQSDPSIEFGREFVMYMVRSKDLIHWQLSPFNPILAFNDSLDKQIANESLTEAERKKIAAGVDINNSDMDFCEYKGQTIIYYSWGNQHGNEFLAEAYYDGPLESFLQGYFCCNPLQPGKGRDHE